MTLLWEQSFSSLKIYLIHDLLKKTLSIVDEYIADRSNVDTLHNLLA